MKIAIIGIKASGKSSVAKIISKRLNLKLIDTDKIIEENNNDTCSNIFKKNGKSFFLKQEEIAFLSTLSLDNIILSLGGGFCDQEHLFSILKKNFIIFFIHAKPEDSFSRIRSNVAYLEDEKDKKRAFIDLGHKRNLVYGKLCDYMLLSSVTNVDNLSNEIIRIIKEIDNGSKYNRRYT